MYLNKLEIFGFKSFANRTVFKFAPGITAVVGPNGCGKTNVVDAIRWVLGEQKTTVLRSEVMENVIFNGTGNRKPLGLSEVSLTLENTKDILPTEYSDVVVTRRLYRDGDSNYLLNNTNCRLKDILDLFMDTGMGADSYSVIELKMVEAILSGKVEERRHLVDEAAGINKYKLRRKEATRKLSYIQNDLVRVQDIVQEIEKQVASLGRQASKTKRYNKLHIELKDLEHALIVSEYRSSHQILEQLNSELSQISNKKLESYKELQTNELFLKDLEVKFHNIDEEFQKALLNESTLNNELAENNQSIAVNQEKIRNLSANINRLDNEIEMSKRQDQVLNKKNIDDISYLNDLEKDLVQEEDILKITASNVKIAQDKVDIERNNISTQREEVLQIENEIRTLEHNNIKNAQRFSTLETKIQDSIEEIERLDIEIEKIDDTSKNLLLDKENHVLLVKSKEEEFAHETKLKNDLIHKIDLLKSKINELHIQQTKDKSAFEFLSSIAVTDDSSKFLVNLKEWLPSKEKPLLVELIDTEEKFRVAVEAALGDYARVFVVDTAKDAEFAMSALNSSNKGKAAFLCRESIPEISATKPSSKRIEGVYGLLSELVNVDNDLRNALRIILGNSLLVDNLDIAKSAIENSLSDRAITLNGEILEKSGVIKGGGLSKKEGITVGKVQRLDKLKKAINDLTDQIANEDNTLISNQDELKKINPDLIARQIRELESKLFSINSSISQIDYKKESLQNNISLIKENILHFETDSKILSQESLDSTDVVRNLKIALEKESLEYKNISSLLEEFLKELSARIDENKNTEHNKVKILSEISALRKDIENNTLQINNHKSRIKGYIAEIEQDQFAHKKCEKSLSALNVEVERISKLMNEAQSRREYLQQQKQSFEHQINNLEIDLNSLRKHNEKLLSTLHQTEIKISEINTKLNSIIERTSEDENGNINFDTFELPDEFSVQDTKEFIQDLKAKLIALGSVNFLALEEFEEQNQRLEIYKKQLKDLVDSEKTLQETIKEINKIAEEKFLITFTKIREHFQELFKKLFTDEGEADLKLTGDNLLECDIEIVAKPPGKRPHSIEMLSGGEKTLTSIAFLFGIYLVKPSPFCILDEVDAPLDDANIGKFIDMIREFSVKTQFLIVTHNKKTMESADTIYGITQEEEGISKIVSVKFENQNVLP
jgi:chromosome segregation protein